MGGGLWLVGVDTKPDKGAGGLAENVEDPKQGGGDVAGARIFI